MIVVVNNHLVKLRCHDDTRVLGLLLRRSPDHGTEALTQRVGVFLTGAAGIVQKDDQRIFPRSVGCLRRHEDVVAQRVARLAVMVDHLFEIVDDQCARHRVSQQQPLGVGLAVRSLHRRSLPEHHGGGVGIVLTLGLAAGSDRGDGMLLLVARLVLGGVRGGGALCRSVCVVEVERVLQHNNDIVALVSPSVGGLRAAREGVCHLMVLHLIGALVHGSPVDGMIVAHEDIVYLLPVAVDAAHRLGSHDMADVQKAVEGLGRIGDKHSDALIP